MESITVGGVTFRWNGDDLILTTWAGQELLTGSDAALLLDFLQLHQQEIFSAEQHQTLPSWARPRDQYISGHISEVSHPEIESSEGR
jgi:hypothetical protein